MNFKNILLFTFIILLTTSCGIYSLSGAKIDAKTIQIDFFQNNAALVEPTLSSKFTQSLQDLYLRQTNLTQVKSGGELQLEGEITNYTITPAASSADLTAALNRLTVTVNVRFYNTLNEADNFEKTFSDTFDFPANDQLSGSVLENAYKKIFERITQDIFNESVAKW